MSLIVLEKEDDWFSIVSEGGKICYAHNSAY